MPEKEIKRRGGAIRYRTIELGNGEYAHIAVVRKPGPRGGRTIIGRIRKKQEAYA